MDYRTPGTNPTYETFGDGTRDYSSLSSWVTATAVNCVGTTTSYHLNMFPDSASFPDVATISGATVNATYRRSMSLDASVTWNGSPTTGVRFVQSTSNVTLTISEAFFRCWHFSVEQSTSAAANTFGIACNAANAMIIGVNAKCTNAGSGTGRGFRSYGTSTDLFFWMCTAWECEGNGFHLDGGAVTKWLYGCKAIDNGDYGFNQFAGTCVAKNCAADGNATGSFDTVWDTRCIGNAADDTLVPGMSRLTGVTFAYVDYASNDYRTAVSCPSAGMGADLSDDDQFPFDVDLFGVDLTGNDFPIGWNWDAAMNHTPTPFEVLGFIKTQDTAPATQNLRGMRHTPVALVMQHINFNLAQAIPADMSYGLGFADETTQFCVHITSEDNVLTTNARRHHSLTLGTGFDMAGSQEWAIQQGAFSLNQSSLTVNPNPATDIQAHILSLGNVDGSNLQAKVGTFTTKGSTGSQIVSSVPFEPEVIIFLTCGLATASANGLHAKLSLGMSDAVQDVCVSTRAEDGVGTSNAQTDFALDRVISIFNDTADTELDGASLTNFRSNGFELNWLAHGSSAFTVGFLALRGFTSGAVAVDTETAKTTTGTKATTGLGGQPQGVLTLSAGDSQTTPQSNPGISLATAFADARRAFACAAMDQDGLGTTNATSYMDDHAVVIPNPAGSAACEAELDSLDADGYTLDWTKVTGAAETFATLAGEVFVQLASGAQRYFRNRLFRR